MIFGSVTMYFHIFPPRSLTPLRWWMRRESFKRTPDAKGSTPRRIGLGILKRLLRQNRDPLDFHQIGRGRQSLSIARMNVVLALLCAALVAGMGSGLDLQSTLSAFGDGLGGGMCESIGRADDEVLECEPSYERNLA